MGKGAELWKDGEWYNGQGHGWLYIILLQDLPDHIHSFFPPCFSIVYKTFATIPPNLSEQLNAMRSLEEDFKSEKEVVSEEGESGCENGCFQIFQGDGGLEG